MKNLLPALGMAAAVSVPTGCVKFEDMSVRSATQCLGISEDLENANRVCLQEQYALTPGYDLSECMSEIIQWRSAYITELSDMGGQNIDGGFSGRDGIGFEGPMTLVTSQGPGGDMEALIYKGVQTNASKHAFCNGLLLEDVSTSVEVGVSGRNGDTLVRMEKDDIGGRVSISTVIDDEEFGTYSFNGSVSGASIYNRLVPEVYEQTASVVEELTLEGAEEGPEGVLTKTSHVR